MPDQVAAATIAKSLPPRGSRVSNSTVMVVEDDPAFLARFCREASMPVPAVDPGALALLETHAWPGNIRELRNTLERAMLLTNGDWIDASDLILTRATTITTDFALPPEGVNLEEVERQLLVQALERSRGNQTHAGQLLGINRDQVRYRIEKFHLQIGQERT